MRTEEEMLSLIRGFAQRDERVRSAVLSGSRADARKTRDIFQDYDVLCLVTEMEPFIRDRGWLTRFGDLMIMQTPDEMGSPAERSRDSFAFLMLFQDGNRIDLTLHPVAKASALVLDDPSIVLVDKDGLLDGLDASQYRRHGPVRPTEQQYLDCCNEFWWVSTYVAKGLWRRELPYAKSLLEGPVRDMLHSMLEWRIGVEREFTKDPGKFGKHYRRLLPEVLWDRYVGTFPAMTGESIWDALLAMADLFREMALTVGERLGFPYPEGDDRRVTSHLHHVRGLPPDAEGVY